MRTTDLFEETYTALSANRGRTLLTILGIVIGIGSVIAMISIGNGAKTQIQSSIEGLGSNLLTIFPGVVQPGRGIVSSGRGSAQTLKNSDIPAIESIPGIAAISPEDSRRFQVVSQLGNNTNTTITGALPAYATVHNISVDNGSFITDAGDRALRRQAVLGATAAQDLFGDVDPIDKTVRINGGLYTVIGVLTAKGGAGFSGPDDMIFVPLSTMQKVLSGDDYFSTISISVADKNAMSDVQSAVTSALTVAHRVSDPDFSVISQEDILGTLSQVVSTFTLFLASIAGISLLVGGIGIMNMMLTTVTERTREIGLRKAIGARRSDINLQFLTEAVALTLIGGLLGVLFGVGIALLVSKLGVVKTSISASSIMLAFGVSAAIGILFGYYPARRASHLNPIDALRYE